MLAVISHLNKSLISILQHTQDQQVRLLRPYNFKASPVGANGKLYLASEEGNVIVLKMGEKFEVLATNVLEDQMFIASPVIVEGELFLRSQNHLCCISESRPK